jgi:hypothetical protein
VVDICLVSVVTGFVLIRSPARVECARNFEVHTRHIASIAGCKAIRLCTAYCPYLAMIGTYQECDEDRVRPFVECGSTKSDFASVAVSDLDWFGNTTLHHCFANNEIIMPSVCKVLEKFPEYASVKNQFGRIPLHYALDKIKVNVAGVRKLIEVFPEGVRERDNDLKTPYDIAVKWKHSREIKKLLLDVDPNLDRAMHFRIRYGILADIYNLMFRVDREPRRYRVYTNNVSAQIVDATTQPGDGNDALIADEPSDGINPVSSMANAVQLSEPPYASTACGDISEQNSSPTVPGGVGRTVIHNKGDDSVRRGSLHELTEEES